MNPPPLPSDTGKMSFSQQAAIASLAAPLLVLILGFFDRAAFQDAQNPKMASFIFDVVAGVIILTGLAFGIVALLGIPKHGPKGILGRGIAGLMINGLLILIFITNFISGFQKSLASRAATLEKVNSAAADLRSSTRKSFDPKAGFTNVDAGKLDRLNRELNNASQNLSGDDALISRAMAAHVARMQSALTNYQAAVDQLRTAQVLNHFDSPDKGQFAPRREVVQRFLHANAALTQVITNSENAIRADLMNSQVSSAHIKTVMDGYHASAAPINVLTVQIRKCDDRIGEGLLDALNLLEAQSGKWSYDTTKGQLQFDDDQVRAAYNKTIEALQVAGADQLKLQKQLVSRQQ